jgi:isocitrate lyase
MFELALNYSQKGMTSFVTLQEKEFAAANEGFTATKHQREVGTGFFDTVTNIIQQGQSSTTALKGSTEEAQFNDSEVPSIKKRVRRVSG